MTQDEFESARHDLGVSHQISAESVGPSGQRYFRLRTEAQRGSALVWLEKEQLYQLALSIKQLLRTEMSEQFGDDPPSGDNVSADHDFKAAQLALGHDTERDLYVIMAHERASDARATVAMWMAPQQINALADQAFWVCAAGRPHCPLCGAAINDGESHICARTNGHAKE
jgi:uncharacterized repeat protein (TIGR03847 family)